MLKKIKEFSGVKNLSKNAQKEVRGGRIDIGEACSNCEYYARVIPYVCSDPGYICCWDQGFCG